MQRLLRGRLASSLALLCCLNPAPVPASPRIVESPFPDAFCDVGTQEYLILNETETRHCRHVWRDRTEEARRGIREHVLRLIRENRARRELEASLPPPPPPPVTIETFMNAGSLSYGDVVVTDRGPRVFIGKPGEAATPDDFVAVDSSRSPHKARAMQFDGAFPERRAPRPASPHRERQP